MMVGVDEEWWDWAMICLEFSHDRCQRVVVSCVTCMELTHGWVKRAKV